MIPVESIKLGKATRMNDAQGRYIEFCKSSFTDLDLSGLSILLDCANGATYSVAPSVFKELGAKVDKLLFWMMSGMLTIIVTIVGLVIWTQ